MADKVDSLRSVLESMLLADETITARATVRRSAELFKNASDITRHVGRRKVLDEFINKQGELRGALQRHSKQSHADLEKRLALQGQQLQALRQERDMLVASHRAMLSAVAEAGGAPAWNRFFHEYRAILTRFQQMGALVADNVSTLRGAKSGPPDR